MKRIISLLAIVMVLTSCFVLTACNKNDSSTASEHSDSLTGQWQSEKLPDYVYTFNADGTGKYNMAGNVLDLTYKAEEGKITISFTAEGYTPVTLNYELNGDRLNIKDSFGKDTFYLRVKE